MLPRFLVTPWRTISFDLTLLAKKTLDWKSCTQIIPGLFLGSLPINKAPFSMGAYFSNSAKQIINFVEQKNPDAPLVGVVSVVELDELDGVGFWGVETVSEINWKEHGIERITLKMCDHDLNAEIDVDTAIQGLEKMHAWIQAGKSVYVHCKAGRARSAMICAAYLAAYVKKPDSDENYSVEEAVEFLQSKRKQVSVYVGQLVRAKEISQKIIAGRDLKETSEKKSDEVKETGVSVVQQLTSKEDTTKKAYASNTATFWNRNKTAAVAGTLAAGATLAATVYRIS